MRARGLGVRRRPGGCGGGRRRCFSVGRHGSRSATRRSSRSRPRSPRAARHGRSSHSRHCASPRCAPQGPPLAVRRADRVPARDPLGRAGRGARLPRRAGSHRTARERPSARVAVRGDGGRRGAGLDPACRGARSRSPSSTPAPTSPRPTSRRRARRDTTSASPARDVRDPDRARHVRGLDRSRLGDERRGHRRLRRRREAARRARRARARRAFTDVDEAIGIVYAVDHGAKIINLSLGGPTTSATSGWPSHYAASHGVLLVAAAGNDAQNGNPVEYPAALLQPVGSDGASGLGLAVGASTMLGAARALLELRLVRLARRAGRRRARRAAVVRRRAGVPGRPRARLPARPVRPRQRHLVRGAAGVRRRRARLGGEPVAHRGGGRARSSRRPRPATAPGTPSSATACSTSPPRSHAPRAALWSTWPASARTAGSGWRGADTASRRSGSRCASTEVRARCSEPRRAPREPPFRSSAAMYSASR